MGELTAVGAFVWVLGLVLAFAILTLIFDLLFGFLYLAAKVVEVIERRWNRERSR